MIDTKMNMNVSEAIATRRSVRAYTAERLDADAINSLLAAAVRAPNAIHEEKWAFVIIQGRAELQRLSEHVGPPFAAETRQHKAASSSHAYRHFNDPGYNFFYNADTLILICAQSSDPFVGADCWLAAENLMLAACAMGLGTCVIGSAVAGLNMPQLKAELGIPARTTIVVPIIVGFPGSETAVVPHSPPVILAWKQGV